MTIVIKWFQPTVQVKVEKITIDIAPNNPYFGDVSSEIFSPGDIITLKMPIKTDFPESMKVIYLSIKIQIQIFQLMSYKINFQTSFFSDMLA